MKKVLAIIGGLGLVTLSLAGPGTGATPKAKVVFETLKRMVGTWEGKSQTGMKETLDVQLIAEGSAIMETSSLHMATMYHPDGDRVLLTHYCMARNQPRLKATSVSPDGKAITFTFLDGTNMANRNVGHMDKVVIRFVDKDTYRSQWTWFQNGKEKWMEDFTYRRTKKAG